MRSRSAIVMKFGIFFICCLLPLFILFSAEGDRKRAAATKIHLKNKRGGVQGEKLMVSMIGQFIGKKCEVRTMETIHIGIIDNVEENWLALRDAEGENRELVNLEYVTSICLCKQKRARKERVLNES